MLRLLATLLFRQHSKPVHNQIAQTQFNQQANNLFQAHKANPFRRT